jgi:hypothetical protein
MSDSTQLEQEARVFGRYLLGRVPSGYVIGKYRWLSATALFRDEPQDGLDRALLTAARWHPWLARIADLHARFFRPTTRLRKKLLLLAAILECSPGSAARLNRSGGGSVAAVAALVGLGVVSVMMLVAGLVIFLPARIVAPLMGARS